jgi:ferritin-like metal-binding protein YciE
MQLNNLQDVLVEQLADLYSAENQLVAALPKLAGAAHNSELKEAFNHHLEETRGHVKRLDEAFTSLSIPRKVETCAAMKGLIEEGSQIVEASGAPDAIDAALIAAAQRVEHYEISAYGTARTLATELGYDRAAALLDETLDEESKADKLLTKIADGGIFRGGVNEQAASQS